MHKFWDTKSKKELKVKQNPAKQGMLNLVGGCWPCAEVFNYLESTKVYVALRTEHMELCGLGFYGTAAAYKLYVTKWNMQSIYLIVAKQQRSGDMLYGMNPTSLPHPTVCTPTV